MRIRGGSSNRAKFYGSVLYAISLTIDLSQKPSSDDVLGVFHATLPQRQHPSLLRTIQALHCLPLRAMEIVRNDFTQKLWRVAVLAVLARKFTVGGVLAGFLP